MPKPTMPLPVPDPSSCPVIPIAEDVLLSFTGVKRTMNRLRRAQSSCAVCTQFPGGCTLIHELQAQISAAITEVEKEWGLF